MRSTLFFIPHSIGPITVFGFGWIAVAIVATWVITVIVRRFAVEQPSRRLPPNNRSDGKSKEINLLGDFATWLVVLAAVVFVAPRMETVDSTFGPIGLPIRGYGVFLVIGVACASALAMVRLRQVGASFDHFFGMAIWTVVGGMVGGRLFYVVQKWTELEGTTILEKLYQALKFTEGGLVVYGALFGGLLGALLWCQRNRCAKLQAADIVTPAFFLGLAFGRLGCLMNGCCFGGVCTQDMPTPAIVFPVGSPPYMRQIETGRLLGIEWVPPTGEDANFFSDARTTSNQQKLDAEKHLRNRKIKHIESDSWAQRVGLAEGDVVDNLNQVLFFHPTKDKDPASPPTVIIDWMVHRNASSGAADRQGTDFSLASVGPLTLPGRSLPVHPTQIYASISAFLFCAFTFLLWPNFTRNGAVFAVGLIGYGCSRLMEEYIRVDEAGQFGTSLTISQWISVGGIAAGCIFLICLYRLPKRGPFFRDQPLINH